MRQCRGAAGERAAAKAERELNSLMFDVSGRVAAIATAQRAWLLSAPPLQTALHMFLDVIAPDAVRKAKTDTVTDRIPKRNVQ